MIYTSKPIESGVYFIYKINLKQNAVCFDFSVGLNDRFLTNRVARSISDVLYIG